MKTYIKGLGLRSFKSFNKKTGLEFGPGMNCVVGPNGSGKSNVLDALCFVLGRLSTKSIRAENYSDLIHKRKGGANNNDGDVVLHLDNSANIFPVPTKHIEISRHINKHGQTLYRINGKRATRNQVLELLAGVKVTPDGHNIILQGDIDRFIAMSANEKRQVLEEVAGIWIYENKKNTALKELDKVAAKLREVQIVMTEKGTYLQSLEEEKKAAEQYRSYESELERSKASELKLKRDSVNSRRSSVNSKLDTFNKKYSNINKMSDDIKNKLDILHEKVENIEQEIEKKGGENQLTLQKGIENLRIDVENSKNLIKSSENEIKRIDVRKIQLQKSLSDIKTKLADKLKEVNQVKANVKALDQREAAIKRDAGVAAKSIGQLERDADVAEQELAKLIEQKASLNETVQNLGAELKLLNYKLKEVNAKLDLAKAQEKKTAAVGREKTRYKSIIQDINKLTSQDSRLAAELGDLRRSLVAKEDELARARIDLTASQEMLRRDRAIGLILNAKKDLPGVHGTVAELGRVDSQYKTALGVAAGARMKNIVVDNENTAVKGLGLLRNARAGVATFLPLNKISASGPAAHIKSAMSKRGVIGLASELVSCDSKFKRVFQNIFRNTLVIESAAVAKYLGIGRYSMVTLDGDIFNLSGAITGGFRHKGGIEFAEKTADVKLDAIAAEVTILKKSAKGKEKDREEIDRRLLNLRREKAELEGRIGAVEESEVSIADIQKERAEITSSTKRFENEYAKLQKELAKLREAIDKKTVSKNHLRAQLRELKFGKKKTELAEIDSKKRVLENQLAALEATIENGLLPERENISRVLASLEKEKGEFREQITDERKNATNYQNELAKREKEEKSFFGQLKKLFADKNLLGDQIKKEEKRLEQFDMRLAEENEEKNSLSIAKARLDAEFAAIKEEFEPYIKVKVLPYLKTIQAAKDKQRDLQHRIDSLGNVNMRALEIYEAVKKEFDKLNWRVNKLDAERESIIDVINKIEHKKVETFMNTFNAVNRNFSRIFGKITEKMQSRLILENEHKPFEGGIKIGITDSTEKHLYIDSLSGGEKTLVALAFIFAIQEHEPAPFYLLDEIDAALDKVNSEKVADLLKEYSSRAQVIVISHNDAIISAADQLHGIWMNKQGESFVNALKL